MEQTPILEVKNLKKYFKINGKKVLKAVDDVSFTMYEGETLGIVGESGSGKTTCGKTCLGMLKKTEGEVLYKGSDIHRMTKKEHYDFTSAVQMIFQDPYASLDPHLKVYDIVAEGIQIHHLAASKKEEAEMVHNLLEAVGMNAEHERRYVSEFSGGQRQRIGIARALAVNPEFLLCDEPISALDVSIQAQIINLLKSLQQERNLTMLFIAHDLSMVRYISDRIAVMYMGKIIEIADAEELCDNPLHPYTKALLSAVPIADPKLSKQRSQIVLEGEIANPVNPGNGCRFFKRCKYAKKECENKMPQMLEVQKNHYVACHLLKI
jgi:peptide/nickel transport system ATP-binding protein/oligopeptide transport system ATP-binding protein